MALRQLQVWQQVVHVGGEKSTTLPQVILAAAALAGAHVCDVATCEGPTRCRAPQRERDTKHLDLVRPATRVLPLPSMGDALLHIVCAPCCAVPEDRRPPSWVERARRDSRNRPCDLTAAKKTKLLAATWSLPSNGRGKVGAAALCAEAGVGRDYVTRCLLPSVEALGDEDVPFARKERCDKGVPTKLTPRKDEAMKEKALEWGFDCVALNASISPL